MRGLHKNLLIVLISILLLITTVNAEGTSIILDTTDNTTNMTGEVLVLASVMIFIFAALIIIKILLMNRGNS